MKKKIYTGVLIAIVIAAGVCIFCRMMRDRDKSPVVCPDRYRGKVLRILWAKWKPADYLQELSKEFTRETGVRVEIVQYPWSEWCDMFFDDTRGTKYAVFDMVIGDSQWLGLGATERYYVELTKWIKEHKVDESMITPAIAGYSEYPKGSGHYWAVPIEGDAMGFSYRKDLFEDRDERDDFRERYGYELEIPRTWEQLKDIAEFFYRPGKGLYGVFVWTEPHYDGITMGIETLVWAWGAALGDHATYKVKGILNSDEGVEAVRFYKSLNQYNNPEWVDHYIDRDLSSNQPMMNGKVAVAMGYFAIFPELLDPGRNPYADVTGFFACPGGPKARAASLGGQGISIVSSTKKKDIAFKFLEWLVREDVQKKWARMGGLSCNREVLYSEEFLSASPIHKPFVETVEIMRDFWAVPEYDRLMSISQKYWYEYVVEGGISAEEAMNAIAGEWENIFEENGYYRE